ncbi:uncharacterized protein LOC117592227 isoform X2 [Drosophila guanche]|uniref:Blast:Zinc finger protein 567 n=1 Tax=Drosophila guanche TaxID=7266 RepID=A0A3B0JQA6_DROGU|nr:uncharacterized protein LOC117592227 isoform X2 [Drosophila guanche]SPP74841.1 blast:Zinc finger protein 567 [Drosophila guanche]
MDNKTKQLDFKLLVDQSLNLLDSLNTALRCDAIQFLLQTLKCKYPDACDQVVRNLFSHITNDNFGELAVRQELAKSEQLTQLLLATKKEKKEKPEPDSGGGGAVAEIKREHVVQEDEAEEAGSTDLNQNFEKILCKEEFLGLDEEEEDFLHDPDTENSSSLQFQAGNHVDALGPGDPLDLIQGGGSLLVKRKYEATFGAEVAEENHLDEDKDAANGSPNGSSSDGKLVKRMRTNNMHVAVALGVGVGLASVRRKEERSSLGEGYVFHEDSQYTLRYHHSTGEFSERAFKAQFRALLRLALSRHHKPFLKQFYENFVENGRLMGTTPSTRVLKELRDQRLEEWRRQRERRQLVSLMKEEEIKQQEIQNQQEILEKQELHDQEHLQLDREQEPEQEQEQELVPQLPAISFGDSEIEMESETESQLSSAAQEIMKFEEFIDDGVGAGRLIDGLEMEPEIDDMLAGAGSALCSVNSASGNSSNSSSSGSGNGNGNGIGIGISGVVLENNSHHSHHLSSSSSANLVINGLTSSNSINSSIINNNNNNNNGSLHCQPMALHGQGQGQDLRAVQEQIASGKSSLHLPMNMPLESRDLKGGSSSSLQGHIIMSGGGSSSVHANEIQQLHQHPNHYNSSNNPLSMMGGMMQQQHVNLQHQQQQQQMMQGQFQQHGVSMMNNRQMPALAALSNLGDDSPVSSNVCGQLNSSLELDDNDLSPDEDDDELDTELDEMDAAKQQLIDGGSSSSTSLQAPPSQHGSGSGGSGGHTPGSKKDKPIYNCLLCPKSYRKRKSLLDHYKMHPGFCHDCGQPNGNTLEEIIHHNRTMHVKEFPFVCETCGESYSRKQQFHAHVDSHSKKDFKTFPCGECGLKFPQKKLQQHFEETGHKADGAICEVCGEEFTSKNALYQHIIRVHKRDNFFECHICHNRFTLKANLERHVQLHTEVKRTYVCDLCGSSYYTYPALKEHYSNAHVDVSECKCTLCGKRFGSAKSLQRHLPSHSEERPHCCNYCDQTFKWKTHLVRHKQTMHGNQTPPPKKGKQRFPKSNEEAEMAALPDMPGPPPVKASKKSTTGKAKLLAGAGTAGAALQQQQKGSAATPTPPPPVSTTPGCLQQDQFNAAMVSSNSSQSSTASTSQHSVSTSESQQNSMYNQSFNAEKLPPGQQAPPPPPQQQQPPPPPPNALHQQHPTPPPTQQQQQQQQPPRASPADMHLQRMNSFGQEGQFHFEAGQAAGSYQQHQLISQYQQQQQQQQQHLRSHTPQSPHAAHPPHPSHPSQIQQQQQPQHFSSPHHMPPMHHQHQLMMQQQHRHNQRSPLHHHPSTQQLQQQHQQPSHSPQHARLQSPQPTPVQQQQQQQQFLQQQAADSWGNMNFGNPPNNQQELKDNKFYIVDSAEFLGLPMNVPPAQQQPPQTVSKPQQQQQQQPPPQPQQQPQQDPALAGDLMSFQHMWPAPGFSQGPQQQQQPQQQQPQGQANPGDPHNYNNIGSILTNLIDSPAPMEYNFDLIQHQQQQQQQQQQPTAQQQQQAAQQQHHNAGSYPGGLMRSGPVYGGAYEQHMSDQLVSEQQKQNSFQPYHLHGQQAQHPHLLPPAATHGNVYERTGVGVGVGYSMLGDESKAVLPPMMGGMMQQMPPHGQQPDLIYYPVKND